MSVLDHLLEYRVVKVVLPLVEGEHQLLDGVAKTTTPPQFEITFLPDQLKPDNINLQEPCQVSFDVAGSTKSIRAKIDAVVSAAKILFEMVESFSHIQKRSYFRVEAELSVSYWIIDDENPAANSISTPVNISGGGLRLPIEGKIIEDTKIGLEIVLNAPQPRVVECVAQVVRTYEMGDGTKQVAMIFVDIEQEDQDAIVAYCLAEQRKQLRLKVLVLGS